MQSRTLGGFALFGVSLLIAAIAVVIVTPPPNGYEISMYDAYPGFFWLLVIGAALVGALVVVGSARIPDDTSWMFGMLLVLMTNALVLLLPSIRGYLLYGRSDPMSHIGFVRDILNLGDVGGNIYAPTHLLILMVSDVTGLEPMTVGLFVPVIFSGLYFGGMYYVLIHLSDSREQLLLALPFVLLPILGQAHLMIRPYDLSLMLLPIVFFLFFKSQRTPTPSARTAFVVVLVGILLYHPLTALFLIGIFTLYFVGRSVPRIRDQYATPTNVVSLSAVIFLAWYTSFIGIINRFETIYRRLFGTTEGRAPLETYTEASEAASPALIDILRTITFTYGVEFVLFSLGFLFLGLSLLLFLRGVYTVRNYTVMLGGTLFVFSFGGLAFLLSDIIVPHTRPFQIAKIAAVILAGSLFYFLVFRVEWIRNRSSVRSGAYAFLVIAITLLVGLSILSLYPSPLGSSSNSQVTEMELTGADWITEHGNTDNEISGLGMSYHRSHHALFGVATPDTFGRTTVPDRFNYTEHDNLGQSYTNDNYLHISRHSRIVYPELFPDYRTNWRYTPEDFDRLDRDRSVLRVYDNGDYDQYLIRSTIEN